MNKMHSLAKIVLVTLALYIAYRLMLSVLMLLFMLDQLNLHETPIYYIAVPFVVYLLPAVLIYQLLYKRDKWAQRIIGTPEPTDPKTQVQWLPVAFRLASVIAGFYFLLHFVSRLSNALYYYVRVKTSGSIYSADPFALERIFNLVLLLAIAVYLLIGAPHFVRWQVKKTIEQCKELLETNERQQPL